MSSKIRIKKTVDLTEGSIPKKLLLFALPLIIGNILQQFYNIVDTIVVGKYLGEDALAAVGSAYTIMILITSIIIGLCMGASVFFSIRFGQKDYGGIRQSFFISFVGIFIVTIALNAFAYALLNVLINLMSIPIEIQAMFKEYMLVIFSGNIVITPCCGSALNFILYYFHDVYKGSRKNLPRAFFHCLKARL